MQFFSNKRNSIQTAGLILILAALFQQSSGTGSCRCWYAADSIINNCDDNVGCSIAFGPAPTYQFNPNARWCNLAVGNCYAPWGKCIKHGDGLCCGCGTSLCNNETTPHAYDPSIPPPPPPPTTPAPTNAPGSGSDPNNTSPSSTSKSIKTFPILSVVFFTSSRLLSSLTSTF